MGQNRSFVIVHLGAGNHSCKKEDKYKKLIRKCCEKTLSFLENSDDLLGSLVQGIKILEDSGIVNAGSGSNKNIQGNIEAEASLMQLDPPCIGTIGCAVGFINPIEAARQVLIIARDSKKLSNVIFGIKSSDNYNSFQTLQSLSSEQGQLLNSDTIGIICIDSKGHLGMACSSGGPEGKFPGRIGPCAIPGVGFWGVKINDCYYSALFTGIGEQIIIKGGARTLIDHALHHSLDIQADNFLDNLYQSYLDSQILEFGFIFVSLCSGMVEIFVSHSTPSFIFAWSASGNPMSIKISRLNSEKYKKFSTCLRIQNSTELISGAL